MTWQQTLHEDSFTAKDFLFADGRQMDLRRQVVQATE